MSTAPLPGRTVTTTARLLLLLTAVVSIVFVVVPMTIGSQGLNLTNHVIQPLTREHVMSIEVTGTTQLFRERLNDGWPQPFPMKDSAAGTVDAATGKPAVELFMFDGMQLDFWGPTALDRLAYAGPSLLTAILTLVVLLLLYRIVTTIDRGEVFSTTNAVRIRWIAATVGIGGVAAQFIEYWAHQGMIARSAAAGLVQAQLHFSAAPLLAGALILVLAEVFRQGVRLRHDVEGLV